MARLTIKRLFKVFSGKDPSQKLLDIERRLSVIEKDSDKGQKTQPQKSQPTPKQAKPKSNKQVDLSKFFKEQVKLCRQYYKVTGRHLPVCGELGEIYAELKYGFTRHKPHTQGSDGRKGNDLIEVKTITPINTTNSVTVKRAGNFNKLCVVKVSQEYKFEARMIARKEMGKGKGKLAKVSWTSMKEKPRKKTHKVTLKIP